MQVDTVAKDLLFATVRLVTEAQDGEETSGTGFILDLELMKGESTPVLVTSRHVVEEATEVSLHLAVAGRDSDVQLRSALQVRMVNGREAFFYHPDDSIDIAIAPIGRVIRDAPERLFYRALPASLVPDADALDALDAIEELIFVGYPDGRWDSINQTPTTRRGITATPVWLDYDGRPYFLIDGGVFPGSSGSPVLIYNTGGFAVGGSFAIGQRMMLVGVLTDSLIRNQSVNFGDLGGSFEQGLGLGTVLNARALVHTIDLFCANAGLTRTPRTPGA
ncbi:serine protease [Knoellia sp. S7-12]|uniref:S1 family peptidase n=1 Tax=Knoellia sp. S7-12 TaxID=3126698 RepID=UPI003365C263